ncbi:G8 domain-containing protein [Roseibium sp. HPY-6]|uniref:G8 domain-containing protein n=1 Tax=Roseibium sp. HPY-6 TaxID=3229852 RepID=UPI00338DE880
MQAVLKDVVSNGHNSPATTSDRDGDGVAMKVEAVDSRTGETLGTVTDYSIIDTSSFDWKGFRLRVNADGEKKDEVERFIYTLDRVNKNGIVTESKDYLFNKSITFDRFKDGDDLDEGIYRLTLKANADHKEFGQESFYFGVVKSAEDASGSIARVRADLKQIHEKSMLKPDAEGDGGGNPMLVKNNDAFLMAMGANSRIEVHAADAAKDSWTVLDGTAEKGSGSITVAEKTGWEVGDKIAITSTDYEAGQAETFTISAVSADGLSFTLDKPLKYMHYGETQTVENGLEGAERQAWTIDERAQVALLSRNVKITGDSDAEADRFGGHTMVMNGAEMHVSGAEFTKMGQEGIVGRYPAHWHMLGDAGAGQYIQNSSFHNTYNKGITIHGTNQTVLKDNVVYDTVGHSFFIEDGSETGNLFQGNIGFGTRAADEDEAILRSDIMEVATYWITNPHNDFVGNIAGGSENGGFWYAIGRDFTGLSKGNPLFEGDVSPARQKAGLFDDNAAHSNEAGLFKTFNPDEGGKSWAKNDLEIHDFNTFRNREWSANFKTAVGGADFYNSVIGAAPDGLNFNDNTSIQNSLSYGVSGNTGNPNSEAETEAGHSFADDASPSDRLEGLAFYSGEFFFEDSHFAFFDNEQHYALSSKHGAGQANYVRDITFEEGFDPAESFSFPTGGNAGRAGRAIYDEDGALSGVPGAWLTQAANAANSSAGSYVHPDFDVFVITDARIAEIFESGGTGNVGPKRMTRHDAVDGSRTDGDVGVAGRTQLAVIGDGNDYVYVYDFGERPLEDNQNRIRLSAATSEEYVFIESPNATSRHSVEGAIRVGSFDQLKAAPQKAYYYEDGSIYVKLFGGGSSKDVAGPSVINYELNNAPQPVVEVPDVPYKPIKYTPAQLAEFAPSKAAPTPTPDTERATHDPEAFNPKNAQTADYEPGDARWSQSGIWSNGREPGSDDIVVVGQGERVVLDRSTQVKAIFVDGGELIAEDEQDLELAADWILVVNGGLFQVGTEDKPFQHEFTLTLEGDDPGNDVDIAALRASRDPNIVHAVDTLKSYEKTDELPASIDAVTLGDTESLVSGGKPEADDAVTGAKATETKPAEPGADYTLLNFALVDTDTDQVIAQITDNEAIDFALIEGRNLSISARAASDALEEEIASVLLELNGHSRIENVTPYALFGDKNGDYLKGEIMVKDEYDLAYTVYADKNGKGDILDSGSLAFSFDDIAMA